MSGKTAKKQVQRGNGKAPGKVGQPVQAAPVSKEVDLEARRQAQAAEEARRQARFQRQAEARAAAERAKRAKTLRRRGILALLAVAVVALAGWLMWQEANKPGQQVAQQPSQHITSVGVSYNSDPPTSGPHLTGEVPPGISSVPITKELQVHNLEDGNVIIDYRPDLDKATVDKLGQLVKEYNSSGDMASSLVMAPYPGLTNAIAVTAWNRIDRMDVLDEPRLRRFIEAYRGKDHHNESGS